MNYFTLILYLSEKESRACLIAHNGSLLGEQSQSIMPITDPDIGPCLDPLEIIYSIRSCIHSLLRDFQLSSTQIQGIHMVSQPFGVVVWDKQSGLALKPVILC